MESQHKKILKAVSLDLRHLLEGSYDATGQWHPGDLEQRLAAIGVRRDRPPVKIDEMPHLSPADRKARQVVDAYLQLRAEAGVSREQAVAEFVRETAFTWANRLLALRCMEARELIDEVILQKPAYGGRSLEHHRLAQRQPELCAGEDDGLLVVLDKVFAEQARHLPMLFDPEAPGVPLKPSAAAIKRCMALLSESQKVGDQDVATSDVFKAPDAFGWAYQYWNTEEKDRVFAKVRTQKGAKIEGADIIPATQLYTEPYMVKFLVQNSLGATWMGMHPDSKLPSPFGRGAGGEGGRGEGGCGDRRTGWEYYVRDADRAPVEKKPVTEITFLDPACGSGHFLLEAFDLFYDMYAEEGQITKPEAICRSILENNLYGIDIDARAVQIAEVALWMKAAERALGFEGKPTNLVAAVASHLKGPLWEEFLAGFEREPSVARVLRKFGQAMEHIDELGSLARPDEELRAIIHEEHATWERQVAQKKEANYLFAEMVEDKLSGQLPFHEVSDEEFGERMLYRARAAIHAFTEKARQAGTFQDQFLGQEATAGFKLFDVLGRKYDVVAANPPYMGSKNMAAVLKNFVEKHYAEGKRDLYAAFILRCLDLAVRGGRVAMVTQQSWMFLRSFAHLRTVDAEQLAGQSPGSFAGLLRCSTIETLAHLGPGAFGEISGEVVNIALFTLSNTSPSAAHRLTAFRLIGPKSPEAKNNLLLDALRALDTGTCHPVVSRPRQARFLDIPQAPLAYWLRERFFELLAGRSIGDECDIPCGPSLGHTERFVRFFWECRLTDARSKGRRWCRFDKGGGYRKWAGFDYWRVDWERNGVRVKHAGLPGMFIRNEGLYFKEGWVFSSLARSSLGVRFAQTGVWGSVMAAPIMPRSLLPVGAIANSRLVTAAIRWMRPQIVISESYVGRAPLPEAIPSSLLATEAACVGLKQWVVAHDPIEGGFNAQYAVGDSRPHTDHLRAAGACAVTTALHTLEGFSERIVLEAYSLSHDDVAAVVQETGTPAGWFPLVAGYDAMPLLPADLPPPLPELTDFLGKHDRLEVSVTKLTDLKAQLRALYKAGPGASPEDDGEDAGSEDDDDNRVAVGAHIPIPTETFLEQLSQRLEIHPISVYWLLKEGIERNGWRCLPEEQRLTRDRFSVLILRLLGHRWPNQIEAGEPLPDWADQDGIIPLTEGTRESTLIEQIRAQVASEPSPHPNPFPRGEGVDAILIEREFAEIMGKPLDHWLATEFFKHHASQFKKRPIAWQIQSGKFTARKKPAFACLVYYHKLDGDLLPKLRTQYVGPLRQRMETELRGIEATAQAARSERQEKRHVELEDQIEELREFDAALAKVIAEGFASKELTEITKEEPLDKWCSLDGSRPPPGNREAFLQQESAYFPDINDGVRVNIAPLQKAGLLAADVLAKKDLDKAIADRAKWRADERRWCREGKLPQPGWWPGAEEGGSRKDEEGGRR